MRADMSALTAVQVALDQARRSFVWHDEVSALLHEADRALDEAFLMCREV